MPSRDHRYRDVALVYDALVRLDGGGLDALVEATGRSEIALKPVLDALVDEGLVWIDDGPSPRYGRVDRVSGLAAMAAKRRADLDRMREGLELNLGVLDVLLAHSDSTDGWTPRIERVCDLLSIRGRLAELHRISSVELLAFDISRPSRARAALRREAYEASAKLDREWLARGGSMRTIFTEGIQHESLAWAFASRPVTEGGLVRMSASLPMQLLIIDRVVAVVQVDPLVSEAGALFIREPGIVSALISLFEVYWMQSREIDAQPGKDPGELTAQQRVVIGLLELGHKDESIARHLGVSVRTTNKIINETMGELGAESRFQAGVLAARAGWLTVPPPDQ